MHTDLKRSTNVRYICCAALLAGISVCAAAPLRGIVSSAEEGHMEGVLVTATAKGSTVSTTVVSDADGRYDFPGSRLSQGPYTLTIRALGYELTGPGTVVLQNGGSVANIKLQKAADITGQLTNSEWLLSAPGSDAAKREATACSTCHPLVLPTMTIHTAEQFRDVVLPRMAAMSSQSAVGNVQTRIVQRDARVFGDAERLSAFLASMNLSSSFERSYRLRGFERPRGRATRVIITSYVLPRRTMQPHDVVMADDGYAWISNFGENSIARLDPSTGAVKEYPYPALRPAPFANGNLDLEFDPDGYIWIALMNQTGIARFDRKAETFELHPIPDSMRDDETQQGMVAPVHSNVDGKIWVQAVSKSMITRFDKQTKQYEPWRFPFSASPGFHIAYGVYTDAANNAYLCGFANDYIWRIDAKSGDVQAFQVPTRMSKPRRGRMTPDDKLVFAEWWADKVGLFDTRTNEFREWTVPGYFPAPYDAEMDREGWIWTDNTMDDRVTRIDTRTGLTIQYLLPIGTNARRISVDHFGARPAVWIGSNHEAVVMKIEPLD